MLRGVSIVVVIIIIIIITIMVDAWHVRSSKPVGEDVFFAFWSVGFRRLWLLAVRPPER